MGQLIDGRWSSDDEVGRLSGGPDGRFKRADSPFRDWVTADGSSGFEAAPGRYRLYVSYACPWAHRTIILRALKGLEDVVPMTVFGPDMGDQGWAMKVDHDPLFAARFLWQVYAGVAPGHTGRATTPLLVDQKTERPVSNESSDIVRMFNSEFDAWAKPGDFYPAGKRAEIDALNATIYETVNNGVYKAGFATTQAAYEEAVDALFDALDGLEARLSGQRYLTGEAITEADWRLFVTLARFDAVYHGHFKCNKKRLADYPNLWAYTRDLYQVPGVAPTVRLDHVKAHYYGSQRHVNPSGIVPVGPAIDFTAPHGRGEMGGARAAG